jgi:hypothetical protein
LKSMYYKRNRELCALCLTLVAIMSISCLAPLMSAASPDGIARTETGGQPTRESTASSAGYLTKWYVGAIYPSGSPTDQASSVCVSIKVPSGAPLSDELYYALVSVDDSALSYDQIGIGNYLGTWMLVYSWSSGPINDPDYHTVPNALPLTSGVEYTFYITVASGTANFIAYQGLTQIWSTSIPTGGNYLIISDKYSGYDNYQVYEEVKTTHTSGGSPGFEFYFSNNGWISDGAYNPASWTSWSQDAPSNMVVEIMGSSVLVSPRPDPSIDSPADVRYTYGTTGHSITWHPSSAFPSAYLVTSDGSSPGGDWNGGAITVNVDGLSVGTHTFLCIVWNVVGESVRDEVTVTVPPLVISTSPSTPQHVQLNGNMALEFTVTSYSEDGGPVHWEFGISTNLPGRHWESITWLDGTWTSRTSHFESLGYGGYCAGGHFDLYYGNYIHYVYLFSFENAVDGGQYYITLYITNWLTNPDPNLSYSISIPVYTNKPPPPVGGGCPYLYVYNGSEYANEGLLDIHTGYNGTDLTRSHVLTDTPAVVDGTYRFRLTEHWETISHINQVKLFATLGNGMTIQLPLVYAVETQVGNVLPSVLFDDNTRAVELGAKWNNGVSQSIELRFLALPPWIHVVSFTFVIIGYNPIHKE